VDATQYFGEEDDVIYRHARQAPESQEPRILTARLQRVHKDVNYDDDNGHIVALRGHDVPLFLYGRDLADGLKVKLTTQSASFGSRCSSAGAIAQTEIFKLKAVPGEDGVKASLQVPGDKLHTLRDQKRMFFCLSHDDGATFVHQGNSTEAYVEIFEHLLPIWLMIVFICVLLCLSGLFSGLNLGLMALDQTELKIVQNTGTKEEKGYANKIAPIRAHGNFLLCSLLLGNVLVNNTLTILLDTLTSGLVAVVGATMGIVIFGEIIPQAICSRHGLAVGAYTIGLTKFFMVLTFPLSYPISELLDKILGAEIGTVYDKRKLIELLRVTNEKNDLEKEEVDIVTGALVYKDKTVRDIMTRVDDVYMLPMDSVLDFETISEIREQGYSRIPVFDKDRKNIVHILFAKDLMFVDPDDNMPIVTVCEFYSNDVNCVFHDTPLNVMFNEFKSGEKGHMAFVQEIVSTGESDPYYEIIGLVTLEDIIEEIIQQEIVDETDVITDNRTKRKRKREKVKDSGFQMLTTQDQERVRKVTVSPQLALAVFQYLTTSVEPFKPPKMNDNVLKKLLALDVFKEIKLKKDKTKINEEDLIIISKGKAIDFFVLIIEGKVEVNIGREGLIFESGPFTYFGVQTLQSNVVDGNNAHVAGAMSGNAVAAKAITSSASEAALRGSLRKANTQNPIDMPAPPSSTLSSKRNSTAVAETMSRQGSANLLNASQPLNPSLSSSPASPSTIFVPDYTVRAVSDILYLRIKKSTYAAAVKASGMHKRQNFSGELHDIDRYLERVNEDEVDPESADMLRTPSLSMRSPDKDMRAAAHLPARSSRDSSPRLLAKGDSFAVATAAGAGVPSRGASVDRGGDFNGKLPFADDDSTQTPVTDSSSTAGVAAADNNGPLPLPLVSPASGERTNSISVRPLQLDESFELPSGAVASAARFGPSGDGGGDEKGSGGE